jgi:unsaturated rhamnogalacturonyl hydrolase
MTRDDPALGSSATPRQLRAALITLGSQVAARGWASGVTEWSWGAGTFLLGCIRFAQALHQPFPKRVLDYLDRYAHTGVTVTHVNHLAPGTAAVLAAQATGHRRYLELVSPLVRWVRADPAATRSANGALEHYPGSVWADTVFMAGVFLGHHGAMTGDAAEILEFGHQLVAHAEILQDRTSGLYAHGSYRGETLPWHWGRGNAWCALASVEFLEIAAGVSAVPIELVETVRTGLVRQLTSLSMLQPSHGIWEVLVDGHPDTGGVLETSAAAGIGAAMLRAGVLVPGLPETVTTAGWRAIRGVMAYVGADGALGRVSAGTVLQLFPFGYSVIRDDRMQLWGQGLALHAFAAAIAGLDRQTVRA